jgi:hypothetical protein
MVSSLYAGSGLSWRKVADNLWLNGEAQWNPLSLSFIPYETGDHRSTHVVAFDGSTVTSFTPSVQIDAIAPDGSIIAYNKRAFASYVWTPALGERPIGGDTQIQNAFPNSILALIDDTRWREEWIDQTGAVLELPGWDDGESAFWSAPGYHIREGNFVALGDRGAVQSLGRVPGTLTAADIAFFDQRVTVARDGHVFDDSGVFLGQLPGKPSDASSSVIAARKSGGAVTVLVDRNEAPCEVWRTDRATPITLSFSARLHRPRLSPDGRFVMWIDGGKLVALDLSTESTTTLVSDGADEGLVPGSPAENAGVK